MKVEIIRFGGGPCSLSEFADRHHLKMLVNERPGYMMSGMGLKRYWCCFKDVDVMERGCLIGESGNGDTPEAAMADYCRRLAGRRIAVDPMKTERRNIDVPNELRP